MSKKEITVDLDNETYVQEKTKWVRNVICSEKMCEKLAQGEKNENNYFEEKEQERIRKLEKLKRRIWWKINLNLKNKQK